MANIWQYIPTSTLKQEYDLNSAGDWAAAEREKLTNEWEELQRQQMELTQALSRMPVAA